MFKYYRINKVVFQMVSDVGPNAAFAGQNIDAGGARTLITPIPWVGSCLNRDDTPVVTDRNQFLRQPGAKVNAINKGHSRAFVPNVLTPSYKSTTVGVDNFAYGPKYKQWISTRFPTTPHYGLELAVYDKDPTYNFMPEFKMRVIYFVSFKDTHVQAVSSVPRLLTEEKKENYDDCDIEDDVDGLAGYNNNDNHTLPTKYVSTRTQPSRLSEVRASEPSHHPPGCGATAINQMKRQFSKTTL